MIRHRVAEIPREEFLRDEWGDLDPDAAADQLIAEWHAPDLELTAEDWIARDLADLELLAWDARVQAARCWEIVHVEFPRLRAELCIPPAYTEYIGGMVKAIL